jgi:hypothetical protein
VMNRIRYGFAVVTLVTCSSCSLIRRSQGKTPPPVIAAPPTKPTIPVENPQVPPPPKVQQAESPKIAPPVATQIPAKPPPAPKKVPRPARKPPVLANRTPTPQPPPVVAAEVAPAQNAEPSVLAPVLSASQQEYLNRAIDNSVQQAESDLAAVAAKTLSPTQQANADRARSFILQALQTRATDLPTARTLADRAYVLAQSLVSELR